MKTLLFCLTVLLVGPLCLAAGKSKHAESTKACSKNGKTKCPPKVSKNAKKQTKVSKTKAKSKAKSAKAPASNTPAKVYSSDKAKLSAKQTKSTKANSKAQPTKPAKQNIVSKPVPKVEKPEKIEVSENIDEEILESAESDVKDPESESVEFYQNLPTEIEKE